ncbi:MAG TPA: thioesterase family protein [Spirochaetota bacterium]|nr:thioesterase family protein [Spirochaetota bacterium]HPJ44129.1 thioesterase family protein [Spirochaetota bacterium]HRX49661.1 thioesterase family protein [Spirochaetota bacterium]
MPRVKLTELENYRFKTEQVITIAYLNPAGHVGNSQMADLIHDGRIHLLRTLGLSEINLGDGKTGLIMGDLVINFKAEIFLGEKVIIEADISEVETRGLRFFYRIIKDGKTAALAETGYVTFSYAERKVCEVPEVFIEKLNSYK